MTLESLVCNPFVLRAAWRKVRSWLDGVEWAPEPDYSRWKRSPWEHMATLARALVAGQYRPSGMELLPYPKKGASVRHRVMPTVEDQVAFMIFGVLLAPFIECRLPNVIFGSRWYRGLRRVRKDGSGYRWDRAPFSLADRRLFVPFRRDYALFRRVASWTVSRWLTGEYEAGSTSVHAHQVRPEDYPGSLLPYADEATFTLRQPEAQGLTFARSDLSKAFPSVPRTLVREGLLRLLQQEDSNLDGPRWGLTPLHDTDAYLPLTWDSASPVEDPWRRLAEAPELLQEVAHRWMDLLDAVPQYPLEFEPLRHAWKEGEDILPGNERPEYTRRAGTWDGGLPTGLAVSPILLNVALSGLDYELLEFIDAGSEPEGLQAAYLRFADDLIFLGRDSEQLQELLQRARSWTRKNAPVDAEVRLSLAWSKTRPESVGMWGRRLDYSNADKAEKLQVEPTDRVTRDRLGEFVTYLVERMSDLARDRLTDSLGRRAFDRLHRLHELARWDIDDTEVREDTRLAFAVNRLTRSWIPDWIPTEARREPGTASTHREVIHEIRASVRRSVLRAPWKFGLWRYALRAAAIPDPSDERPFERGLDWLQDLLLVLQNLGQGEDGAQAWERTWPSTDSRRKASRGEADSPHPWYDRDQAADREWFDLEAGQAGRGPGIRSLRVSFLRAHFWREVGSMIRELRGVARSHEQGRFKPLAWYARVLVDEEKLSTFRGHLESLDRWAEWLYPVRREAGPAAPLPSWELQGLLQAAFSVLDVPGLWQAGVHLDHPGRVARILREAGHAALATVLEERAPDGFRTGWTVLDCAAFREPEPFWHDGIVKALLSSALEERLSAFLTNGLSAPPTEVIEGALHDACERLLGTSPWKRGTVPDVLEGFRWLQIYGLLRQVLLRSGRIQHYDGPLSEALQLRVDGEGTGCEPAEVHLHRLLWGLPTGQSPSTWPLQPTEVPTLALPRPWVLRMFLDLLEREPPAPECDVSIASLAATTLGDHRRWQLSGDLVRQSWEGLAGEPTVHWTPRFCLPPHPMALVPRLLDWGSERAQQWAATGALVLALTGDESMQERIWSDFPVGLPWSESLALQTRLLVPPAAWRLLDRALGRRGLSRALPKSDDEARRQLADQLARIDLLGDAGLGERVVVLRLRDDFLESWPAAALEPEADGPTDAGLDQDLIVRLVQVKAEPEWRAPSDVLPAPTRVLQSALREIMEGVESVDEVLDNDRGPQFLMMPELVLHPEWADAVAREVLNRKVAFLSGIYWRLLPAAVPPLGRTGPATRYFVNEALLAMPNPSDPKWGLPLRLRVRKPRPAHIEVAFAQHLSQSPGTRYRIVPGDEWFWIGHPAWGPFTVAICSDLLDPGPWSVLKGTLLHLFMVAWNTDVRLYDAMTWTRAYELFVNLAAVNHGSKGGSLAWTPAHNEARELFLVHGEGHFLMADVRLPIRDLAEHQKAGLQRALAKEAKSVASFFKRKTPRKSDFKSIPPGWQRRW